MRCRLAANRTAITHSVSTDSAIGADAGTARRSRASARDAEQSARRGARTDHRRRRLRGSRLRQRPAEQAVRPHHQHHRHHDEDQHQRRSSARTAMPKACSTPISRPRDRRPARLPMPPTTTTTNASTMTARSICRLADCVGQLQRAAEPGERRRRGRTPRVNSSRWLTPSAADHLAVLRRRAHQRAPARALQQQPQTAAAPAGRCRSGPGRRRESAARAMATEPRSQARARQREVVRPPDRQRRHPARSAHAERRSSWNSSGAR